ncbi:MAG: ribbon-helix-helix domain-containing protein [Syntrophales bacterium LBB04]|nr:ribbon-helix-helix domain-containing protein [Syntrophales bacterium LBB04]
MKTLKKKQIQVYIEPEQDYVLGNLARKRGVSKAEIIRKSLDKFLREIPLEEDPAMGLVGLGSSGKKDLSENHDKYLVRNGSQKKSR